MSLDRSTPRATAERSALRVDDLRVRFRTFEGSAQVLDGVSLEVRKAQRVGLVGESGCGKSVTLRSIMGILPTPPAEVTGGAIAFEGRSLLDLSAAKRDALKGGAMSMVFQDPMTALNPVFRIGQQMDDVLRFADRRKAARRGKRERKQRALDVLTQVRLPDVERIYDAYPIQLSGGMRQRVLIAMALLNEPRFLLADEPGTALDVTTQDEILRLLDNLVLEHGLSLLMITHNLGVVREMTDHVYVMYAGSVVEHGPTRALFERPSHPYTRALLACVPKLSGGTTFPGIDGTLPDYTDPPEGCRFHPRCPSAMPICTTRPPLTTIEEGHGSACWLHSQRAGDPPTPNGTGPTRPDDPASGSASR